MSAYGQKQPSLSDSCPAAGSGDQKEAPYSQQAVAQADLDVAVLDYPVGLPVSPICAWDVTTIKIFLDSLTVCPFAGALTAARKPSASRRTIKKVPQGRGVSPLGSGGPATAPKSERGPERSRGPFGQLM